MHVERMGHETYKFRKCEMKRTDPDWGLRTSFMITVMNSN